MFQKLLLLKFAVVSLLIAGCEDSTPETPPVMDALNAIQEVQIADLAERQRADAAAATAANGGETPDPEVLTTGTYQVEFETTCGNFTVEVNRSWAPLGAERFHQLVSDRYYNGAGFFRVVDGFMVQWGLAADPRMTKKWAEEIADDPVVESNKRGYMTFAMAGPNSRTTQVFVNYADNSRLDEMGFAPFAVVIKGMETIDKINSSHGEDPDQTLLRVQGNGYLKSNFPKLDYIIATRILQTEVSKGALQITRPADSGSTDDEGK